jgi:hypothetical protein
MPVINVLIGVRAGDPVTFGGTLAVILAAALPASAWPAWRASRIDPLVALSEQPSRNTAPGVSS